MKNLQKIVELLESNNVFSLQGALPESVAEKLHTMWPEAYVASLRVFDGRFFASARSGADKQLVIIAPQGDTCALAGQTGFEPEHAESVKINETDYMIAYCPLSHENANALRAAFAFTRPRPCGIETSFGMGDRLGIATPGHIRAARAFRVFPILAQQSIREMQRTGRSPAQVLDDAAWAVFQEGFERGYGADADHLKTEQDVRTTADAGFTMFTIDPSEHLVDSSKKSIEELKAALAGEEDIINEYSNKTFDLHDNESRYGRAFHFGEEDIPRIAAMYLPAVRHTIALNKILVEMKGEGGFDLEVSVDETETPTTPEAHLFVIRELKKAGVRVVSLAPRFVGEFQKGIDYIGDEDAFRDTVRDHALIARALGPYKLSIHSGSDKFRIFPIVSELTCGLFHEKTAGTSYLEAMRVIARRAPALYRDIHAFALSRFQTDRASYHVTTNLDAIRALDTIEDAGLPALMDQIDPRQLIHITYGSVLTETDDSGKYKFYDRFMDTLNRHEQEHYETVAAHFVRHCQSLRLKPE